MQAFDDGLAHHQAGRLTEAAAFYQQVLVTHPQHFDALHLLGVVRLQQGDAAAAAELVGRALALDPSVAAAHSNLAAALTALGRHDAALAAADGAVALQPTNADAHRNRAGALRSLGRLPDALATLDTAVALATGDPAAQFDRGNLLADFGRFEDAVAAFDAAIALARGYAEAHNNRASALSRLQRHDQALASADRASALAPTAAEPHNNRGAILGDLQRHDEALAACDRAIALRPDYAEAHYNRGNALLGLARAHEALAAFDAALALRPDMAKALNGRGVALQAQRRYAEALASFDQAVALAPEGAEAQFNRSVVLLATGDFAAGFDAYRWRWRAPHTRMSLPQLPCPLWAGEDLTGKAIVVHAEQGFGDAIQFIRFVAPLAAHARRVTVRCDAALVGLFRSIPGIEPATSFDAAAYDFHIPMLDLPHVLGLTSATIPAETPYLAARATKIAAWAKRLPPRDGRRRVGLVWAGNSRRHNPVAHAIDKRRSLALAQLAPLGALTDVQLVSLQKGEPAAEARPFPLVDVAHDLADFEDTAALIAGLDLVISVDTAVAHLAGALGKPVWILSRFDGCWRWLDGREDSPWYPTARLFHQRAPGDWEEVIARVAAALAHPAHAVGKA